jgi:opacity protein-like surface antigen
MTSRLLALLFAVAPGVYGVAPAHGSSARGNGRGLRVGVSWGEDTSQHEPTAKQPEPARPKRDKPWHVDLALRGSSSKLASTDQQLDRRLELPMRMDLLGLFDEPYTPLDRKTDLGLSSFYVGVGRQESKYLVWTLYMGGGWGQDLNHQDVLNVSLEVDFRYSYYYTGVTAEIYPWQVPHFEEGMDSWQRLCASRPFLLAGFETGYVRAEGEGEYKVGGFMLYHDEHTIRDWLASVLVGAGWAFPLSDHWSFNITGDYAFHLYRPEEYNGWNWIMAIRYTF